MAVSLFKKKKIQKQPPERQKQSPEVFCEKTCSEKFRKLHRKTPVLESFLIELQAFSLQVFLKRDFNTSTLQEV